MNPDNARYCWNDGEQLATTGFQPFRFRSGAVANSLSELVTQIDAHWEDGKYSLYQGDLANWFGSIGRSDLASAARNIASSESDQDIGLEKFLQSLGGDAPPAPQLQITPGSLDFGTVDGEQVASSNPTLKFRISNAGRGHLYGTVRSSDSWLTVDTVQFHGNAVTITAKAVSEGRQATIEIDSNGGKQTVPVTMTPVRPWYRIGAVKYAIAFVLIALGEFFPARYLVNLKIWKSRLVLNDFGESVLSLLGIIFFPALGSLLGLGIALLITRTHEKWNNSHERWKGYLRLFWAMPLVGVFAVPQVIAVLAVLLVLIPGVDKNEILVNAAMVVPIVGYPIACLIYYAKFEK